MLKLLMQEHIGLGDKMNKLENFGPVYVINLESQKDRLISIENQLKEYGVTNYKIFKAYDGSTTDFSKIIKDVEKIPLSKNELGATVSHIFAIKQWLDESDSDYAIFVEDDLSLETSDFWDFSWQEFLNAVDQKYRYDVLQLCIIHNYIIKKRIHLKERRDWSAGCYLIKRKWAETLVNKHLIDGKLNLYPNKLSVADAIIYQGIITYAVPLFTTKPELGSSINEAHLNGSHASSRNQTIEFWKEKHGLSRLV